MTSIAICADYVCPYCMLAEQMVAAAIGQRRCRPCGLGIPTC